MVSDVKYLMFCSYNMNIIIRYLVMFPAQFQTVSVGGLAQPGLVTLQHHQPLQPQGIHYAT